jgi:hypothetical protein
MALRLLAASFAWVLTAGLVLAPDTVTAGSLGGMRAAPARMVSPRPVRPSALTRTTPGPALRGTGPAAVPTRVAAPAFIHDPGKSLIGRSLMDPARTGAQIVARPPGLYRVSALSRQGFHSHGERHRGFGFGLPLTVLDSGAFYGTYYDPSDAIPVGDPGYLPDELPVVTAPAEIAPIPVPVINHRPLIRSARCSVQDVTVASEHGGAQTIRIVRGC